MTTKGPIQLATSLPPCTRELVTADKTKQRNIKILLFFSSEATL